MSKQKIVKGFLVALAFAVVLSVLVVAAAFRGREWAGNRPRLLAYFFVATASHGVLDALEARVAQLVDKKMFIPARPFVEELLRKATAAKREKSIQFAQAIMAREDYKKATAGLRHVALDIDVTDTTGQIVRGAATQVVQSRIPNLSRIAFDLIDPPPCLDVALMYEQPGLLLIGVDSSSNELLILSGRPQQAMSVSDLVAVIDQERNHPDKD